MDSELEKIIRKGGIITRANSNDPRLVIFGEYHNGNGLSPRAYVINAQPTYFFCEGVTACEELDFEKYQSLNITRRTRVQKGSFRKLIKEAFFLELNNDEKAIITFFDKIPETVFVGIELPGQFQKDDELVDIADKAIKQMNTYLRHQQDQFSKGTPLYCYYGQLRRRLKKEEVSSDPDNAYKAYEFIQIIREKVDRDILRRAKILRKFYDFERKVRLYNKGREEAMGFTMATYMEDPTSSGVATVGADHLLPHSSVFRALEERKIPYIAISLSKAVETLGWMP